MNIHQFTALLVEIHTNHSWPLNGRGIKYVRPSYDVRTGEIYGIRFDAIAGDVEFFIVNENRHRDLYKWIMDWLNSGVTTE